MANEKDEKLIKRLMAEDNISRENAIYQINRWS